MYALALVAFAAVILAALFIAESLRSRRSAKLQQTPRIPPRRQPHLEDAIRAAFEEPAAKHGQIFLGYEVWKREQETRLELAAAEAFGRLNEFTRCLIVRHLWRALERASAGSVVIVDDPPQMWSQSIDVTFHDCGVDPWRLPVPGLVPAPQFAKE